MTVGNKVSTHLSECYNRTVCVHLPTVCQRKSDAAGQEGCLCQNTAVNKVILPLQQQTIKLPLIIIIVIITFLVLNLDFDILNGVTGLHLEGDGFAGQRFHEDLHFPVTVGLNTIKALVTFPLLFK